MISDRNDKIELLPLPESVGRAYLITKEKLDPKIISPSYFYCMGEDVFTAKQMREYALANMNRHPESELEECRKAFEQWYKSEVDSDESLNWNELGYYCNKSIEYEWLAWHAAWKLRTSQISKLKPI